MRMLSLGIAEIDADHLRLEEMVQRVEEACQRRLPAKEVRKLLSDLVAEIQAHFVREQDLMIAHEYAAVTVHVAEHEHLVHALEALERLYAAGDISLDPSLVAFLWSWLQDHVAVADLAYAEFVCGGKSKARAQPAPERPTQHEP